MSLHFLRYCRRQLTMQKVYENEHVFAFHDIRPAAPVHILVVPKNI